ncbi:MAG: diguanylate cyclase [Magnetococcales bacterium]|nr:diguanylate cyclase [Magnetococcales bacterium]
MLLTGLSVLVGLGVLSAYHTQRQEKLITEQYELTFHYLTHSIVEAVEAMMLASNAGVTHEYAMHLKEIEEFKSFRIMRTDGMEAFRDNETIAEVNKRLKENKFAPRDATDHARVLPQGDKDLLQVVRSGEPLTRIGLDQEGKTPIMTVLTPILNEKPCYRCHSEQGAVKGILLQTFSMAPVTQAIQQTRLHGAVILVIVMIVVLGMIVLLIRYSVTGPIQQVTTAMSAVASGKLDQRVPVLGADELGCMAMNFNRMSSELARVLAGLKNEREKLTTIILSAREGMVVTDRQGKIVLVNPAAERLLEKSQEAIVSAGFLHILDDPEHMRALLHEIKNNIPSVVVHKGRILNVYAATIHSADGSQVGSAALIRDITQEKKLEQQLRQTSTTDALTGLCNRRRFDEVLLEEWSRSKRYNLCFSLLMFDVDHFKKFNDEHGHDQGDRVLQAMGQVMRKLFRDVDYPCRYGGEEFVVILPNTAFPGANLAAERLRKEVEELVIDGLKVTISIGVAIHPGVGVDSADMLKQADIALYASKKGGRNRVTYVGA